MLCSASDRESGVSWTLLLSVKSLWTPSSNAAAWLKQGVRHSRTKWNASFVKWGNGVGNELAPGAVGLTLWDYVLVSYAIDP